jgi:hypothetical protein
MLGISGVLLCFNVYLILYILFKQAASVVEPRPLHRFVIRALVTQPRVVLVNCEMRVVQGI